MTFFSTERGKNISVLDFNFNYSTPAVHLYHVFFEVLVLYAVLFMQCHGSWLACNVRVVSLFKLNLNSVGNEMISNYKLTKGYNTFSTSTG